MRPPGYIKPHLSVQGMLAWVKNAPDEAACKRRMAVWLTLEGRLYARKVAEILGVSVQAVRLWICQYNEGGPAALDRQGRGGRRWAFLTLSQERQVLRPFIDRARNGDVPMASEIKPLVERSLGHKVSMPYIYKMLSRHRWSQIIAQSHKGSQPSADTFSKLARPWQRPFQP